MGGLKTVPISSLYKVNVIQSRRCSLKSFKASLGEIRLMCSDVSPGPGVDLDIFPDSE